MELKVEHKFERKKTKGRGLGKCCLFFFFFLTSMTTGRIKLCGELMSINVGVFNMGYTTRDLRTQFVVKEKKNTHLEKDIL